MEKKTATALLAAYLLGTVGCTALEHPRADSFERARGEYVVRDESTAATWSQAASAARLREGEERFTALKPTDLHPGVRGQSESTNPTFTDKITNFFHPPKPQVTNANGGYNRTQVVGRSGSQQPLRQGQPRYETNVAPRGTFTNSEAVQNKTEGQGFWSKLFPSKPVESQDWTEPNVVIVPQQRREQPRIDAPQQPSEQAQARQNSGFKLAPNRLFSAPFAQQKLQSSSRLIEEYDQLRFFPPSEEIERYYYPSGSVAVQPNGSCRIPQGSVQQSIAGNLALPNARTNPSYDAPIYQAMPSQAGGAVPESGFAHAEKARAKGSAVLSPIVHTSANIPTSRLGSSDARSLGVSRPVSRFQDVSQASYAELRPSPIEPRLSPESLFGWSSETNDVLSNFTPAAAEETSISASEDMNASDASFLEALGRRPDFSWINSTPCKSPAPSAAVSSLSDELSTEGIEVSSSDREVSALNRAAESTVKKPVMIAEPGASLDDIFDSAVFSSGEPQESDPGEVDETFPTVETTPLVDAIVQNAEPLEEKDPLSVDADPLSMQDKLLRQANETAAYAPAPETVVERNGNKRDAPLTNEEIAWVDQIKSAIETLLQERDALASQGKDVRSCDARLRLLYLVIGEYERSIQNIQDDSDPLKVFWEKECRGLETLLQNRLEEIDPSFVAERLSSGLDSLASLCDVKIRKALLVNAPACYGLYEERQSDYNQGGTLYAYTELDYVSSRESVNGYSIDVECRWRLVDAYGNIIIPFEAQRCSNVSETKLRDIVLNISVPLPKVLGSGEYTLELEVVDLNAAEPKASIRHLTLSVADVTAG